MSEKNIIKRKIIEAIESDQLSKDSINKASLFGSFLYGTESKESDVDLVVELNPSTPIGFFKLAHIRRNLESFIGRKVDLLTPDAMSPYFRNNVLIEAESIYER